MAGLKSPFHQVISYKLITSPVGLSSYLTSVKAAEILVILDILHDSKMPATAAHEIAEVHAGLPKLLKSAGNDDLAKLAEEVLADLRGREDEKKDEAEKKPENSETAVHP